jgi:uncharacterized protein (TIGR00251 family)
MAHPKMIKLTVKVFPNAKKNTVEAFADNVLKVRITACPEKGKANDALIALLADFFHIPKNSIRIVAGLTSRLKRIEIDKELDV